MALTISIGSGKGGAGKSMIIANLALLLAKSGKRVCVVDLDIGGADMHILYGLFKPEKTLTDFMTRKVDTLSEVIHTFDSFYGLQLVCGSGDTLQTANMTFQEKQRILRAINTIDTDIILIDTGAGASYHVLDFFMYTEIQLCVVCPDPTSIMDFYKFLQLATIRKALGSFLSQGEVTRALKGKNFTSLAEVFELAGQVRLGAREKTQKSLEYFHPLLIINRVGSRAKINQLKLRKLAEKYLGIFLPELGEVPEDGNVMEALKAYLPVCEYAPGAPSSKSLEAISTKVARVINLFESKKET